MAERLMDERLMDALLRHARAYQRFRRAVARRLAMTETEVDALLRVVKAGQATPGELTSELGLTTGGTTALVQRLEATELLRRAPHPTDGRSWVLTATEKAFARLRECYGPLADALAPLAEAHPAAERDAIADYLIEAARLSEQAADALTRDRAQRERQASARRLWP